MGVGVLPLHASLFHFSFVHCEFADDSVYEAGKQITRIADCLVLREFQIFVAITLFTVFSLFT